MFCPNCGGKLPDGSKFCSMCGEKLTDTTLEVAEVPVEVDTSEPVVPAIPVAIPKPDLTQLKKKINSKMIIGIAVAVVVVIVAIFGLKALFSGAGSDNAYAYLSNGKYELLTDLKSDKIIEIASTKSDNTNGNLLSFSPDGKYLYYYTKYDSYNETGSLCRAEFGKLKEKTSKNDKYIEIIDTDVALGFRFLDDGSVTYQNGDKTLYYFNGEEPVQVAKEVNYYYTEESSKILYTTGNYSDGYSLYGVALNDVDNKIKIASNLGYVCSASDFDNIIYTKYEDDDSETLYVAGFEKDAEKLAENVSTVYPVEDKMFFVAENGTKLNLYDFVEDSYAESDAKITEPNSDDFRIPEYSYEMVYGYDLKESDFDELYTSCTRDLYWYGESTWWSYSMEDAMGVNWGDESDEIHAVTQSFIDKFAGSADENGYILVTDEVKSALKEIQKCADEPENEWQWMWLCFNKYQSGTTLDYEKYDEACNKWYEASGRINLREELKNKENDFAVSTLYCYEKGKLTPVNETVLDTEVFNGGLLYNTTDLITDKAPIDELFSSYDVKKHLYIDYAAENNILLDDGTTCKMSASAAEAFAEAYEDDYATLYFTEKDVYMSEDKGTLSVAPISGGVAGDFSIVTDDAEILDADGDTLYYASGIYESNSVTYCDLYSCQKGTGTRLAKDIMLGSTNLYGDGMILAYTGYRTNGGYELTMIDSKGESTLIAEDVSKYIRVDKSNLMYISDGDLYVYNGKEKKLVRTEVDQFWCQNAMEIEKSLGWWYDYDYYF